MGYYTEHSMVARNVSQEDLDRNNTALKEKEILNYALYQGELYGKENNKEAIFSCYDAVKWYDHEEDMIEVSKEFPNAVFELSGQGEEFGDVWKEYFSSGNSEFCRGEIIYEKPKFIQWDNLTDF